MILSTCLFCHICHLQSEKKSFSSPSASIGWPLLLVDIDRLLFFPCLSSCELAIIVIVIVIVIVIQKSSSLFSTRYKAPRRAAYLGSGSLVALGGASLGCYRFTIIMMALEAAIANAFHKRHHWFRINITCATKSTFSRRYRIIPQLDSPLPGTLSMD